MNSEEDENRFSHLSSTEAAGILEQIDEHLQAMIVITNRDLVITLLLGDLLLEPGLVTKKQQKTTIAHLLKSFHYRYRDNALESYQRALSGENTQYVLISSITNRSYQVRVSPTPDGTLSVFTDITDTEKYRKQKHLLELQLQQIEEAYEAVLNEYPEGVILVNSDGHIQYANTKAGNLLKCDPITLRNQPYTTITASPPNYRLTVEQVQSDELFFPDVPFTCSDRANEIFDVSVSILPTEPKPLIMWTLRPARIREELLTSQAELEAERQYAQWAHFFCHEVGTPLSTINTVMYLLKKELEKSGDISPQANMYLLRAFKHLDEVKNMVSNFLQISSLDARGAHFEPKPALINLDDFWPNILEKVDSHRHDLHHLHFADETESQVAVDVEILDRVITNLVSNALKYTPEGGDIVVVFQAHGDKVRIIIQDSGIGIPPTEIDHILSNRFIRGSNTGQIRGTGLGLAIVTTLIERHQGKIECTSQLGKGTTFVITLPNLIHHLHVERTFLNT